MKAGAVVTWLRDLLPLALGGWGIVYQQLSHNTDPVLLVAYMVMLSVPGASALLVRFFELQSTGSDATRGTPGSRSPQPSSDLR